MIYRLTMKYKLFTVEFRLRSLTEYVPVNETILTQVYTDVSKEDTLTNLRKKLEYFLKTSLPAPAKMLDN